MRVGLLDFPALELFATYAHDLGADVDARWEFAVWPESGGLQGSVYIPHDEVPLLVAKMRTDLESVS